MNMSMNESVPKWLTPFSCTTTLNSPEFHFFPEEGCTSMTVYPMQSMHSDLAPIQVYLSPPQFSLSSTRKTDNSELMSFAETSASELHLAPIVVSSETVKQCEWVSKYEPKQYHDLLTDEPLNRITVSWFKSWEGISFNKERESYDPKRQGGLSFKTQQLYDCSKPLLLAGPPGCGKTTLARVVARLCGYGVEQINASDDRTGKALLLQIQSLSENETLKGKPVCIIVDEVDGALESDENGLKSVLTFIESKKSKKKSKNNRPILFICNDPFVKGLKELRSKATVVYFNLLNQQKVIKRLKEIVQKEGDFVENEVLNSICRSCNNDIRSALGVLELVCKQKALFDITAKQAFSQMNFSFNKDSNRSISEFLSKLLQPSKKVKNENILQSYSSFMRECENHNLLYEQFFHNLLNVTTFFRRMKYTCRLYDELVAYDLSTKYSYLSHYESQRISHLPFLFYKYQFIPQHYIKIEFPSQFFVRTRLHKEKMDIVKTFVRNLPPLLRKSNKVTIEHYLTILWRMMQTLSPREEDALSCLSTMVAYNVELDKRQSPRLFVPGIDALVGSKPCMSVQARALIEQNYAFFKLKSNLVEGAHHRIVAHVQKQKTKVRNSDSGGIKYKYLQGTGNQVNYQVKMGFFFKENQ